MNRQKIIFLIAVFLLLFSVFNPHLYADTGLTIGLDAKSLIVKANDKYRAGDYKETTLLYEKAVKTGFLNGHLFYNLGNAYFRDGKLGLSILSYKRAKKFIPEDEDLMANLKFAMGKTKDKLISSNRFLSSIINSLSLQSYIYIFLSINFLFFILVSFSVFKKNESLFWAKRLVLILYVVSFSSLALRVTFSLKQYGIVTAKEVNVQSGIGFDSVVLFKLKEGFEVLIEDEKDSWYKVKIDDLKKGWVEGAFIGKI